MHASSVAPISGWLWSKVRASRHPDVHPEYPGLGAALDGP
jgi:hypothetical protein